MRSASPLRYPGGKWRIASFFNRLLDLNGATGREYVEPYAGGASLALSLLISGSVSKIHLNELDPAIHAFWWSVLHRTDELVRLVRTAKLSVREWSRQRDVYQVGSMKDRLTLGFATFYLNRTNHSGIMNGGVIGGRKQSGTWRMDARFNRGALVDRIRRIADRKDDIRLYRKDALRFLRERPFRDDALVYVDPPYFEHGSTLYLNAYEPDDHAGVAVEVRRMSGPWIVSYDDVSQIRKLYAGCRSRKLSLLHTARSAHLGQEVMFFSDGIRIPRMEGKRSIRQRLLTL